jgi:hypothetical protein
MTCAFRSVSAVWRAISGFTLLLCIHLINHTDFTTPDPFTDNRETSLILFRSARRPQVGSAFPPKAFV